MITPWRYHTISSQIASFNESRPNVTLSNQKPNVSLYDELGTSWKTWEHFEVVGESWRWLAVSGDHNVMTLEVVKHTTNSQATHPLGYACTTHKMIWNTCDNYQSWSRVPTGWVGNELEVSWRWHGSCLKSLTMTKNVEWSLQRLHLATPSGTITRNFRKQPLGCHWSWDLFKIACWSRVGSKLEIEPKNMKKKVLSKKIYCIISIWYVSNFSEIFSDFHFFDFVFVAKHKIVLGGVLLTPPP